MTKFQTKIELLLLRSIIVMFHHDTPTSEGTRGQKPFFVHWGQEQITPMGQILSITEGYYHSEHLL